MKRTNKLFLIRLTKAITLVSLFFLLGGCQTFKDITAKFNQKDTSSHLNIVKDEEGYYQFPELSFDDKQEDIVNFQNQIVTGNAPRYENIQFKRRSYISEPDHLPQSLYYDSGIHIAYPEGGVKGVYLTATNVGDPEYFDYIIDYLHRSGLNAVVIDFKDDWGHIISPNDSTNALVQQNTLGTIDYKAILKRLEQENIYPIARITTFKDNLLSDLRPDLSFTDINSGHVWSDAGGAQFINPFSREVWDYIISIAKEAAKMGFKDIQFDYVRFPEGFYEYEEELNYDIGAYSALRSTDPDKSGYERVKAINDFLAFAKDNLAAYGVDVSADIFGYTTVAGDTFDVRGIGQNFREMAEQVDVVSSMIYPSHWSPGFFGLDYPDLHPYEVVDLYMYEEKSALLQVHNPVKTRPWLQDFTDTSLPAGTYQPYTAVQVQEQIDALAAHGVHEFLLWNAGGEYTEGINPNSNVQQQNTN